MPIVRLTGHGLAAIAFAVALLWGCVIGEHRLENRAAADRTRVLRDVERLQRQYRLEPVSLPSQLRSRPGPPSAG